MRVRGRTSRGRASLLGRALLAAGIATSYLAPLARSVAAADELTMAAHASLQGHVRPGAWAEIAVDITNNGPTVAGELRVRSQNQGSSQFGVAVELASPSHQVHMLYAQPPLFATKLTIDLVAGGQTVSTTTVPIVSHDAYTPIVGVVAEHPEGFLGDVRAAAAPDPMFGGQATSVITLQPEDLPQRVEAWSAIDRLIWQDVDSTRLSEDQLAAMKLWVSAGGRLVILGGSTGTTTLSAFPAEMLPFVPAATIDIPTTDIASFLGSLPDGATAAPAIGGTFGHGSVMGRSGDSVYAAQAPFGQGQVTIIGLNPAEAWLTRSAAADSLWHRLLPSQMGAQISPFQFADDSPLLYALQNLPAVALPPIENLFVLLLAYIVLIGPINYLILRRLDRREWAWVTMPALVAIFAVGSYGLGATLKGSDVIVNELSIVRAGQSADQGRAQSYIGVYSPSRKTFTVQIANGALISNTTSQVQNQQAQQPLDVLIGKTTSELRNFEVGFGVLRGFRAEAAAAAPKIDASLLLKSGQVTGTVTNNSNESLENVAVLFAGAVAVKPTLAPGEAWQVSLAPDTTAFQFQLSERIFGSTFPRDPAEQRKLQTRRSVIDVLSQYTSTVAGTPTDVPLLLGWAPAPAIDVDLGGEQPTRVGDSLFLVPLSMAYDAQAVFADALVTKTIVESKSDQAFFDGSNFNLGRGTMTVELRPTGLSGRFTTKSLEIALTQGNVINLDGGAQEIAPLPDAQQPSQDDPVGTGGNTGSVGAPPPVAIGGGGASGGGATEPAQPSETTAPDSTEAPATAVPEPVPAPFPGKPEPGMFSPIPALQLWDVAASRWYEFAPFDMNNAFMVKDASRFVDPNGRVLVRLVNRSNLGETNYFQILARIEGTIGE